MSIIQFGSLEPIVLHKHGLPNPIMQEEFFPISVFNKLAVKMTSYSEVEEEANEEDDSQENSLGDTNKNLAALEAMLVFLNWGKIFSLLDETG